LKRRRGLKPIPHKTPHKVRNNHSAEPIVEEEDFTTNWEETVEKFDDLGLKEEVLRGIYGYGFVKPSPIQQKGILPIIQGKDTIAQVNFYIK
jgi:superfamily II DNA/RNA helicase